MKKQQPWQRRYAEQIGFQVDPEMEPIILEGLEKIKNELGARYCPCKLQKTLDNVCPCKELRYDGSCHCGLFYKE